MKLASDAAKDDLAGDTDIGVLSGLVGYHLRRASSVMSTDFDQAVGDLGMRQSLFGVLSVIVCNPGINQGAIGQVLGVQRANMVALINELADRGFVDRRTSEFDRRALTLELTASGIEIFKRCSARIRAHEARSLASLTAAERRELIRLLKAVASIAETSRIV